MFGLMGVARGAGQPGGVEAGPEQMGAQLLWWYEAADSATLGQTSAGLSAVASGDPIGYIADKSVSGRTLTQATGAKRIKLGTDGAGKAMFYFDGTKTISLDSASFNLAAHTKITVFWAAYADALDAVPKCPFYFKPAGGSGSFTVFADAAGIRTRLHNGTNQHETSTTGVSTSPQIYEAQFVPAERRILDAGRMYIQGREWYQGRFSTTDAAGVTGGTFGTGPLRFGDWGVLNYSWEGGIYAMLAVSGDITQAQREMIYRYLGGKSGATVPSPYAVLNFSHANDYRVIDSTDGFNAYSFSTLYYDTSATSVDVTYRCRGVIANQVSLGVYVDGVYHSQIVPSGAGSATATVTLPAGAKRVAIMNSMMNGNINGVASVHTVITNVAFNASATAYLYPSTNRIMVYGDSVATGGHASPNVQHAWALKLRYENDADVAVYAESGRSFKNDYDIAAIASGVRDPFVKQVEGYAPSILWMAMGVNDYGAAAWTAAAFGTAYAATLDALHAALPSLQIYAQSPLNPAYGVANNALGDNLQDYCDAIAAACVGRGAWVTYVDGSLIITSPGTELTDGVHPNNTGNATYAAYVATVLGL